jgi:hypothetical protein
MLSGAASLSVLMSAVAFYVSKNLTLAIRIGKSFCLLSCVSGRLAKAKSITTGSFYHFMTAATAIIIRSLASATTVSSGLSQPLPFHKKYQNSHS